MKIQNCSVKKCNKKVKAKKMCVKHYQHILRHGSIPKRTIFDPNIFIKKKDHYEVLLFNRNGIECARTLIDLSDKKNVARFKWCLWHSYAMRAGSIMLHRFLIGKNSKLKVDHINGNGLDNRRKNLRLVTNSQNCMNTNRRGYFWNKKKNRWIVIINKDKREVFYKTCKDEKEAKLVSTTMRKKFFGKYARRK